MSADQALLYFVDLRRQVRRSPEAVAIVDRCLRILASARTADPTAAAALEAEVEALRRELKRRFGPAQPIRAH